MFSEIETTLSACEQFPAQSLSILKEAVNQAGSLSRLAESTGLRRQSLSLWLRSAVVPSPKSVRIVLDWLKTNSNHENCGG